MKIASVLKDKAEPVITISPDDAVKTAAETMTRHAVGAVMVSSDGVALAGMVRHRDIVRWVAERGPSIMEAPVSELMAGEAEVCSPTDGVAAVLLTMQARRLRHMPVLAEGAIVGLVSAHQLVSWSLERQPPDAAMLRRLRRLSQRCAAHPQPPREGAGAP